MADNVKIIIAEKNGVELEFNEELDLTAENVPYDNTDSGLAATNVKAGIDEISETVATSASPGFSFGRASNVSSGTWLQCEGVPSNKAGRFVYITDPVIEKIFISSETISTYNIDVYEHEGDSVNLTLLASSTVTSARGGVFTLSVSATSGRQLAILLSSGSARNVVAGLELSGSN